MRPILSMAYEFLWCKNERTKIEERKTIQNRYRLSASNKPEQSIIGFCRVMLPSGPGSHKTHYDKTKREINMANKITDETIEYVGILAKLALSGEEKKQAKKDMGRMLDYIDKLNELDTTGVEPMSHVFPVQNVFREDVVTNGDDSENILRNAPAQKDDMFVVPKTFE